MLKEKDLRQLGLGIASLTFGVALSVFIYAVSSGIVTTAESLLLYLTSFLLMLRFWWRYTELFIQNIPSRTFAEFMLDFIISFFGILAILYVNNIQTWTIIGICAMTASAIRCGLSWKYNKAVKELKQTIMGSVAMLIIFTAVYLAIPLINIIYLTASIFVLVVLFVLYTSSRKH